VKTVANPLRLSLEFLIWYWMMPKLKKKHKKVERTAWRLLRIRVSYYLIKVLNMKAIEYSINSSLPPTKPGYSIDNIQSKNRDYFATFEGHSAAIELEFPPCVISSIHIGFMTSTNLRILAYSLPDKSDAVDLIEKRIPYLKESCNACVFNSDQNFPNHSSRVFSGVRVEIENLEERRPFNLNYITLMTPKENIIGTPSPSPGPRTNFYRASFTTPNNSKPKQAPKESSEKSLKQSTLSNFVGMGPSNDNEVLVVGNSVEENLLHTPEIAKQQSRLLSSFKKTQNTTSATRKKKLTNSYAELLVRYR
jgi:hypothetical protein